MTLQKHIMPLALLLAACSSSTPSEGGATAPAIEDPAPVASFADALTQPTDPAPVNAESDAGAEVVSPTDIEEAPAPSDAEPTAPTEDVAEAPDDSASSSDADASAAPDATDTEEGDDAQADVTPDPLPEVRFVVLGDVGEGNDNQYEVSAAIEARCAAEGCDFAILLGDNVYDAGVSSIVDSQWEEKFEAPYANLNFPFYAVLGNHDNGGLFSDIFGDTFDGSGGEFEKGDIQVAYTDVSTKWTMPARTYDFVSGPAHFFALDTNDMMWAAFFDEADDRANAQMNEFPGKIDASDATWKFVLGHHPYVSNGAHGNAGEYEGLDEDVMEVVSDLPFLGDLLDGIGEIVLGEGVKEGVETIVCGRADFYMSGHDHNRQWLAEQAQCPGVQFVVSGAGAKTKALGGSNPTVFEDASIGGFLYIHIVGPTLTAEFIDQNGNIDFSTTMTK
ncbi:MAG: metallophosphoesterase [Myxococcota bacterium]